MKSPSEPTLSPQSPSVSLTVEPPVEAPRSAPPSGSSDARLAEEWAETHVEDVRFLDEGEFFKTVGFCFADELQ